MGERGSKNPDSGLFMVAPIRGVPTGGCGGGVTKFLSAKMAKNRLQSAYFVQNCYFLYTFCTIFGKILDPVGSQSAKLGSHPPSRHGLGTPLRQIHLFLMSSPVQYFNFAIVIALRKICDICTPYQPIRLQIFLRRAIRRFIRYEQYRIIVFITWVAGYFHC